MPGLNKGLKMQQNGAQQSVPFHLSVSIRRGPQKSGSPVLTDEIAQALDAVGGKGHDAVFVFEAEDPDEAILRLHLDCDFKKPIDIITKFDRNPVDGFDGAFLVELSGHRTLL